METRLTKLLLESQSRNQVKLNGLNINSNQINNNSNANNNKLDTLSKLDRLLVNNNSNKPRLYPLPQMNFVDSKDTIRVNLPPRSPNAMTGSQFLEYTKSLPRNKREEAILKEVLSGNVPDFMREMQKISFTENINGRNVNVSMYVSRDYVSIGSNQDFVRIPVNPLTAQKIADRTGTYLPTKKIVDLIYKNSDYKYTPQPQQAGPQMMSNDYFKNHQAMIESQRIQKRIPLNSLVSGHKKDIVITNLLDSDPGKVAIYGWHQKNGKAIQPLSTIHENTYSDYSHGMRMVSPKINIDGQNYNIETILKDRELSKILSYEGVINKLRY